MKNSLEQESIRLCNKRPLEARRGTLLAFYETTQITRSAEKKHTSSHKRAWVAGGTADLPYFVVTA